MNPGLPSPRTSQRPRPRLSGFKAAHESRTPLPKFRFQTFCLARHLRYLGGGGDSQASPKPSQALLAPETFPTWLWARGAFFQAQNAGPKGRCPWTFAFTCGVKWLFARSSQADHQKLAGRERDWSAITSQLTLKNRTYHDLPNLPSPT